MCDHAETLAKEYFDQSLYEVVDIIGNINLENQFIFRIPVLMYDNEILAEGVVTEMDVRGIYRHVHSLDSPR